MVELLTICFTALLASALTLFSGFGLGTLLMPAVAFFFPIEVAVAITAVVHLANNLFKLTLFGRFAKWRIVLKFGIPAFICAALGALILGWLSDLPPLLEYSIFESIRTISPIKLTVGLLILVFVWFELGPKRSGLSFEPQYLPYGGAVSGFFGGLSGHQGAFRSMFLIKLGLDKQTFIATGVVLAVLVDLSRLLVYGADLTSAAVDWSLVIAACLCAFVGAYVGSKLIDKITIRTIQIVVTFMLTLVALGLVSGLI